ncbi:MAG: epoxide hydrolase [Betaproteobacteria bacterium]|nr:epoxide hydrolase [Betaproteobacteria bacterium]
MQPRPFRLEVPESAVADLRERLGRTRFPDEPPGEAWTTGTSLSYLRSLIHYWQSSFDWRAWEGKLNAFRQFKAELGGIELHYIHEPAAKKETIPLLISHGWPGSVFEFYKLLPLLKDRFTVVAPSLPGYGLSFRPGQKRFGAPQIADLYADLMSSLGYERFAYQGGDWGASIGSVLGWKHPQRLIGLHLNLLMVPRDPNQPASTPEEKAYIDELKHFLKEETGYQWIQGTRPQTLAYGLTDSPAGLAAWIVEKFRAWTDNDGNPESAVSRDEMLANLSLYWFTGAIGSSFWPYYERLHGEWPIPRGKTVDVPLAYAAFPKEILRPPRSLASRVYTNIKRWTVMEKGGHFAALENPTRLAADIKAFFVTP